MFVNCGIHTPEFIISHKSVYIDLIDFDRLNLVYIL